MVIALFSLAAVSRAQDENPISLSTHEFTTWFSGAFENGHAFGGIINGRAYEIQGRYGHLVFARGPVAVRWIAEVTPLAVVGAPNTSGGERRYLYAAGGSPIGLQVNLRHFRRCEPFITSNGGFLYFNRHLFSPAATQFNFTAELGGGVQLFRVGQRNAVSMGYKYFHISNAEMNHSNPAMDSHVLFVGVSMFR